MSSEIFVNLQFRHASYYINPKQAGITSDKAGTAIMTSRATSIATTSGSTSLNVCSRGMSSRWVVTYKFTATGGVIAETTEKSAEMRLKSNNNSPLMNHRNKTRLTLPLRNVFSW